MTRDEAKKMINEYKGDTAWYGKNENALSFSTFTPTFNNMFGMFREAGFGPAESACIVAALKLSGAKIQ